MPGLLKKKVRLEMYLPVGTFYRKFTFNFTVKCAYLLLALGAYHPHFRICHASSVSVRTGAGGIFCHLKYVQ